MNQFLGGLAAGYGIAVPVGAIAVLIVLTAARDSFRSGVAAGLGAATADLLYAGAAVVAGATVAHHLRRFGRALHFAGGLVLALIAFRGLLGAARGRPEPPSSGDARRGATYATFVGLTLVNPLTVVYFASIVLDEQVSTAPPRAAAFVAGVAVASASWQLLLAATGAVTGRLLVERGRVATALIGYGIVLVFAARQFQQV